jgi:hypothetical protein
MPRNTARQTALTVAATHSDGDELSVDYSSRWAVGHSAFAPTFSVRHAPQQRLQLREALSHR